MKATYTIGQRIQGYIDYANEIIDGVILGKSMHKGRMTYSIKTSNGDNRFLYESQVWGAY